MNPRFEKKEWLFMAGAALAAVIIAAIPPVASLVAAKEKGLVWSGLHYFSFLDLSVYFSYIDQAKRGAWLLVNPYTTEAVTAYVNTFWVAVGNLARLFDLSPIAAYHIVRLIFAPTLVFVSYFFASRFLPAFRQRATAVLLFLFGTGLGAVLTGFETRISFGLPQETTPVDLWVSESQAFLILLSSPHFIASLTLLLLGLYFASKMMETGVWRDAVWGGLVGFVLLTFHPYYFPTLYAVPLAWLIAHRRKNEERKKYWMLFLAYAMISMPATAYYAALTVLDPNWRLLNFSGQTLSTSPWTVLTGLGIIVPIGIAGYFIAAKQEPNEKKWDALAAWAGVQAALMYMPLLFQRRLIEGLMFPFAVLASTVIKKWWHVVIIAAFVLPSSAMAVYRSVEYPGADFPKIHFLTRSETEAMAWMRARLPSGSVVLSSQAAGNLLPGRCGCRVYTGHWGLTLEYDRKGSQAEKFFSEMDEAARRMFLDVNGIEYVYYGRDERNLGPLADRRGLSMLFENDEVMIFQKEK
jgi:hypothetical protein